jgi:thiamine pyrophosphate-dependent acetolactate synthase large subunit-like protein
MALQLPDRQVIIMDGDGNILMGFGNLAQIGASQPANLLHVVFDNQVYGTTGNQPTISGALKMDRIAKAAGYKNCYCIEKQDELEIIFPTLLAKIGPHFLQIKVSAEVDETCPRIPYSAPQIKDRFIKSISSED